MPGVNCDKKTLRINAVCNRQLATYRHYVVKIGRSRSRLCFLRNPFGQMNTICTSLTLTECLRCYQHIPSLLVLSQKWSKSFTKQSLRQMSTTCNLIEHLRWHLRILPLLALYETRLVGKDWRSDCWVSDRSDFDVALPFWPAVV